MDSLPVTLIVKAPNQQIEDQKIRCETSWTINKLKQHLSEVYPSKPPHHEQKLIYSGQLLNDSLILKDILRQYDGQDTHTVHLVCTPRLSKMSNRPRQTAPVTETSNNSPSSTTPNSNGASGSVSPESTTTPGTQQSRVEDNRVPPAFPDNSFNWANFNGQVPPMMNLSGLNQYQMQMAWMQQAYMQYMAQYMQIASGQIPHMSTAHHAVPPNVPVNAPQAQPNQAAAGAVPPNAPVRPQQENEERDWLDVFYVFSRALVFSTVIYFYSTPVRVFFVLTFVIALYFYKVGLFRNPNVNNNNINATRERAPQEDQAPTRFMVARTFITTFFASLIPEIPNVNA